MAEVCRRLTSLLSTSSPSCSILTRSYDVATLENGGCSPCNSANCATLPLNTSADGSRGESPAARNRRRDYRSHVEDWRVWLVIAIILTALIALILYAVLLPILRHQSHDRRSGEKMNEEYTTPFTLTRGTSSQSPHTFNPPPKATRITVEPVVFFENRLEAIFPTLSAESQSTSRVVATMEKGEQWGKAEATTNIAPVPTAVDPQYLASSSAPDEEDEDDLFWMKLPPKRKSQFTQSMAGSTTTPLTMAEEERKRIVDEELKQVIASLDTDHAPPSTIDYSVVEGGKASGDGIDDIKPVEISFTPPLVDTGEKESTPPSTTSDVITAGEPVWRRLPPAKPHDNSSPSSPRVTDSRPTKEAFTVSAFLGAPHSTIKDDPRHNAPIIVTALLDIGKFLTPITRGRDVLGRSRESDLRTRRVATIY